MNATTKTFGRIVTAAATLALLAGCAGSTRLESPELFDGNTGLTYRTASEALTFARTDARYSRSARDYVYLGPVEVNRQGTRELFLWVGIGTTLDRGFLAPVEESLPQALSFVVAGEPLEYALSPWQDLVAELPGDAFYAPPVDIDTQWAARLTLSQVEMIESSIPDSITVQSSDGRSRTYVRWSSKDGWAGFQSSTSVRFGAASR